MCVLRCTESWATRSSAKNVQLFHYATQLNMLLGMYEPWYNTQVHIPERSYVCVRNFNFCVCGCGDAAFLSVNRVRFILQTAAVL